MRGVREFFERLRLGTSLSIGFGFVLLLALAVGAAGVYQLSKMDAALGETYDEDVRGLAYINEANIHLIHIGRHLRRMATMSDPDLRAAEQQRLDSTRRAMARSVEQIRQRVHSGGNLARLQAFDANYAEYLRDVDRAIAMLGTAGPDSGLSVSRELMRVAAGATADVAEEKLKELADDKAGDVERAIQESTDAFDRARLTSIALLMAALAGGIVLARVSAQAVRRPMEAVRSSVEAIAGGDLSQTVPHLDFSNEVGGMAKSVDVLLQGARVRQAERLIQDQLAEIDRALQSASTYAEFGNILGARLAPAMGLVYAGVYVLDEGRTHVRRVGGYGCDDVQHGGQFALGAGLVGQVALDRRAVAVTLTAGDKVGVNLGFGRLMLHAMRIAPVLDRDKVLAVLEVGALQPFTAQQLLLFETLLPALAEKIQILAGNIATRELLAETQAQAVALEGQARELETQKAAILAQQERLRLASFQSDQALELTQAGYWHIPLDGSNVFNISERAAKVFGNIINEDGRYHLTDEWAVNLAAADKDVAERTFAHFADAREGRVASYDATYPYKRPVDGRIVWIHSLGHVVRDASGKSTDMYGVSQDVTESKLAEEKASLFFRSSSDGLLMLSPASGFTQANAAAVRLFGSENVAELLKCGPADLSPDVQPDGSPSAEAAMQHILAAMQSNVAYHFDWTHKRFDGSQFQSEITLIPATIEGERQLLVNVHDVTERMLAQQALADERARLQNILDRSPINIAFSAQGRIQFANPKFIETFGVGVGDMAPQLYVDVSARDEMLHLVRRDGIAQNHEIQMYDRDRHPRDMLVTFLPITYNGEDGMLGWIMDITERKAAEARIQEAKQTLEMALHAAKMGTWKYFPLENRLEADEGTIRLYGLDDVVLDGTMGQWFTFVDPEDAGKVGAIMQHTMANRIPDYRTNFRVIRPDRETMHIMSIGKFVYDEAGNPVASNGIVWDISDLKKIESELETARVAAETATKAKSDFLATMSHEIRTPMNGVLSMAEMLGQTDLTDDQRSMLTVVRSSADSLLTIINDILDFSKLEAGKMTIEVIEFDTSTVVEDVVQLVSSRAEEKGIGLFAEVTADVPARVHGDPTRLRQIVLNLTGNAVKFTESGHVRLRISAAQPTGVRVEVTDTGIGLTPEQRGKLFQPFQQADTSTARKFGGSGLGLSICRRLVEIMGGSIGVDSEIGVGSTFWFELPLPEAAPPAKPETPIDDLRVMFAGFEGEQARILSAYVQAAGAAAPLVLAEASDVLRRFEVDPGAADVVVLPTYPREVQGGGLRLARALRQLPGCGSVAVGLIVPASLLSSASAAAETGFIATTTEPVRRERFWKMLAVAVGRAKAERRGGRPDASVKYDAPPVERAVASRAVILVAEDNKTNQIVISRLLTQLGLVFEMADNGAVALQRLQSSRDRFGLLLTDFHMPEMDGFELTQRWRELETLSGTEHRLPVLALTADAMSGMAERCTAAGMDGFLTKPIVRDALIAELERWLPVAFELRTQAGPAAGARAGAS